MEHHQRQGQGGLPPPLNLKLNIDTKKYSSKPSSREMGIITKRMKNPGRVASVLSIHDIADASCQGITITAGELAGAGAKDWRSQQLFIFDIDNEAETLPKLTPSEVRELLGAHGIPIAFAYWTFSSTKEHPKFRIAALCDEVVTDAGEAKNIIRGILSLFPTAQEPDPKNGNIKTNSQVDLACTNLDRMFLGTNQGLVEEIGGSESFKKTTALDFFEKSQKVKAMPLQTPPPRRPLIPGAFDLKSAIRNFDLLSHILHTTSSRVASTSGDRVLLNPCPICSHEGDFWVYTATSSYACFSASNGSRGNVINYIMETQKLNLKAAREFFKYELCGIDRNEELKLLKEYRKEKQKIKKIIQMKGSRVETLAGFGSELQGLRPLNHSKAQKNAHLLEADRAGVRGNATGESNVSIGNSTTKQDNGQAHVEIHFLPDEPGFIAINPFESQNRRYRWNDIGISNLFADCYKNVSRYVPETKNWYVYDGRVWRQDTGGVTIAGQAKKFCHFLLFTCGAFIEDDDTRSAWVDFVAKRMKKFSRDTMIADAASVWPVSILEFDKDPFILNCQNCTYNLKDFTVHKHNPNDFLSKISNVVYEENARCERWQSFIHEIMCGDKDTAAFLQKALGYSLTGDTSEECFFILYGSTTRNGKGTTMTTALHLMGDYGKNSQPETIAQKTITHSGAPSEEIARLKGARLVSMSEPDKGLRLNSALVKQVTGGDPLTARFLHQNSFEFFPEYKFFINTNHLPRVHDDSIFASGRVKLIPFERHFSENEQDKGLKQLFRQPENISGIFNWFLDGLKLMYAEGLKQPQAVTDATNKYREESDTIGQFVEECLVEIPQVKTTIKDIHTHYSNWCDENGFNPLNSRNLTTELRRKGLDTGRGTGNKVCIVGYGIVYDGTPPQEFLS